MLVITQIIKYTQIDQFDTLLPLMPMTNSENKGNGISIFVSPTVNEVDNVSIFGLPAEKIDDAPIFDLPAKEVNNTDSLTSAFDDICFK